jgi:hypothetical protein
MWWWIPLGIALAILVLFGASVALGFIVKPEYTGKKLLKRKLKQEGLNPESFSDACLTELVDGAVRVAQLRKAMGNAHFNNALVEQVGAIATTAAMYVRGDKSPLMNQNPIVETIKKYASPRKPE